MSLRDTIRNVQPDKPSPSAPAVFVEDEVRPDFGPAMTACLPKERTFVLTRMMPDVSDAQAARLAGYGKADSSPATLARIAFRLTHENPRVAAAMAEVAKIAVRDLAVDSIKALKKIVRQDFHKDQAKVALALMERVDPTVQRTETKVEITINQTERAVDYLAHLLSQGANEQFLLNELAPADWSATANCWPRAKL